jgi:soluble lytic murein transglycosylase-like protein
MSQKRTAPGVGARASTQANARANYQSIGPALVVRGTVVMAFLLVCVLIALPGGTGEAEGAAPSSPQQTIGASDESGAADGDCEVSTSFPEKVRQWCSLITEHADQNDLPPDLVAALIWQESGGDAQAYSHSGAVGLMQVMPRDGLAASFMCQNGPCFASRPTIAELKDPEYNISYGTRMLAGLRNRYDDLRKALKAYGPMDVGYSYADKVLKLYENYGQD